MSELPAAGNWDGGTHRLPIRVYYEDTDAGGVVYHASYLRFMERGRSEMLATLGIDQAAARDGGIGQYVVTAVAIRYRAPGRLQDALVVASRPVTARGASVVIHQTVRRGREVLTEAEVRVAFLSPEGRPTRQPPDWLARLGSRTAGDGDGSETGNS